MQKIQISFDASKLDKTLMNGGFVSLDVVPLKEVAVKTKQDGSVIEGDTWRLMKSHFVVQSNKNREVKMPIIGEGTFFETREVLTPAVKEVVEDTIDASEIPF